MVPLAAPSPPEARSVLCRVVDLAEGGAKLIGDHNDAVGLQCGGDKHKEVYPPS